MCSWTTMMTGLGSSLSTSAVMNTTCLKPASQLRGARKYWRWHMIEKSAGILVSPTGHAEPLTKEEFVQLALCHQILGEDTALTAAFMWFIHLFKMQPEEKWRNDATVLEWM